MVAGLLGVTLGLRRFGSLALALTRTSAVAGLIAGLVTGCARSGGRTGRAGVAAQAGASGWRAASGALAGARSAALTRTVAAAFAVALAALAVGAGLALLALAEGFGGLLAEFLLEQALELFRIDDADAERAAGGSLGAADLGGAVVTHGGADFDGVAGDRAERCGVHIVVQRERGRVGGRRDGDIDALGAGGIAFDLFEDGDARNGVVVGCAQAERDGRAFEGNDFLTRRPGDVGVGGLVGDDGEREADAIAAAVGADECGFEFVFAGLVAGPHGGNEIGGCGR